jgi:uncharacterized metal-binding protein YceD (DUF177 family)
MNKPDGWHVPVHLENVPETGLHLDVDADTETRARLAVVAGVLDISRLHLAADVTRQGEGLRATGHVTATIGQTCVVTLEPLENSVDETFDVLFLPDAAGAEPSAVPASGDDLDETRERLVNGIADLGTVAAEFFLLGIDRYPRKPGAVFAAPAEDRTAESPFAALARLKSSDDKPR